MPKWSRKAMDQVAVPSPLSGQAGSAVMKMDGSKIVVGGAATVGGGAGAAVTGVVGGGVDATVAGTVTTRGASVVDAVRAVVDVVTTCFTTFDGFGNTRIVLDVEDAAGCTAAACGGLGCALLHPTTAKATRTSSGRMFPPVDQRQAYPDVGCVLSGVR
jgi:hypothetical protein